MAKKSKVQARKRVATKDLEPKDVKHVKGGKAGKGQQEFVTYTLKDALITN